MELTMKSFLRKSIVGAAFLALVSTSCTVNVGDSADNSIRYPTESTLGQVSALPSGDPFASWIDLGNKENSYSQSELSQVGEIYYGAMAAPGLRLFAFENSKWNEITSTLGLEIGPEDEDHQIVIQSELITSDTSLDFVVRFDSAPWDLVDNGNQGRSIGLVLANIDGAWKKLSFWDPYDPTLVYDSVEYVEYVNGALIGQWYGSCGRPCGLLAYTWSNANQRLEGIEATQRQSDSLRGTYCAAFSFVDGLPLKKCQEGFSVEYLQTFLNDFAYELEVDGYYGHNTTFAVQHFQRTRNIRATGIVDFETWKSLTEGKTLPGRDLNGDGVVAPDEITGF
jgi:peptidoglycan hydrolase-like protein with peptidoglycan-binding domain